MIDWSNTCADNEMRSSQMVRITETQHADMMRDIGQRMMAGEGFTVATLNLDHIVKLRRDERFRDAYTRHSHVTADGNPVVWLSQLAGRQIELLPGSDLIDPVLRLAVQHQVPVAFLGSTETSLAVAAAAAEAQYRGLRVVAQIAPGMGFDPTGAEADACIEKLAASKAGLCFVALGAPRQEVFSVHASATLPDVGFMSVGAGLDFISGHQNRAPYWVRRIAAEWLWRLLQNPGRLAARYGACLWLLPGLAVTAWRSRRDQTEPQRT